MLGLRGHSAKQAGVDKKDIDPANIQIRPMKEEDVDAIAAIDGM
jgi:hypothetical protein